MQLAPYDAGNFFEHFHLEVTPFSPYMENVAITLNLALG